MKVDIHYVYILVSLNSEKANFKAYEILNDYESIS